MNWNPELYLAFADHRQRPALDLLARIPLETPRHVVDLGCGPGNVTALLAQRWPAAEIAGIDNDAAMLARAAADHPGIAWQRADIAAWRAERPGDLLFSNAALQWLEDHERLLPRLLGGLAPGGLLAVQMARNFNAPSHVAVRETVEQGPWRERLLPLLRRDPVAPPQFYHRLLAPLTKSLDIWETEYLHVLSGETPVLDWIRGTALRPFLAVLDEVERSRFEASVQARLASAYPAEADGRVLLPFRRLFLLAYAA
jgi:trans-aconitate 2-methyltransferase